MSVFASAENGIGWIYRLTCGSRGQLPSRNGKQRRDDASIFHGLSIFRSLPQFPIIDAISFAYSKLRFQLEPAKKMPGDDPGILLQQCNELREPSLDALS